MEPRHATVLAVDRLAETLNSWLNGRGDVTIVTAESLTGGGVASALTAIPGTSSYFLGGIVAYSNLAKHQLLGVPNDILANPGAVSEPSAAAMAEGARRVFDSTFAVSTTGLAGPGGATARKPVGLVYVAVAGPDGTVVEEHQFVGDRADVTWAATQAALKLLNDQTRAWLDRSA